MSHTADLKDPIARLIVALDVSTMDEARRYIDELEGVVWFYKIGLELFLAVNADFLSELQQRQCRIFLDLKLNDVDETIRRTVTSAANLGVAFITIYGNSATARAACLGKGDHALKILAVPLLSSWDDVELRELLLLGPNKDFKPRFDHIDDYVFWRADQAISQGCDGLIASGEYVKKLRDRFGDRVLLVSPAIRPTGQSTHEHKRSLTPAEAIRNGADYLVVGRPIRDAKNRKEAARRIIDEMGTALQASTVT